jgi:hypothetical protein
MDNSEVYRAAFEAFQSARHDLLSYARIDGAFCFQSPRQFNLRTGIDSKLVQEVFAAVKTHKLDTTKANQLMDRAFVSATYYSVMIEQDISRANLWKLTYG